jgi:hypothetical protein
MVDLFNWGLLKKFFTRFFSPKAKNGWGVLALGLLPQTKLIY